MDELGFGVGRGEEDHEKGQSIDDSDPLTRYQHLTCGREDCDVEEQGKRGDEQPGKAETAQAFWLVVFVRPSPLGIVPLEEFPGVEDDGDLQVDVETDQATDKVHVFLGSRG